MKEKLLEMLRKQFIAAAVEDACISSTYTNDAMEDFEREESIRIDDLCYTDGVLSFEVGGVPAPGSPATETQHYNFKITIEPC